MYKCDICLKEFDNSMKLGGHKSRNHMKEMRLAKSNWMFIKRLS